MECWQATTPPPFLLWCDPYRQWLDLLRTSSSENGFELWADPNEHELVVRDRFFHEPRKPRGSGCRARATKSHGSKSLSWRRKKCGRDRCSKLFVNTGLISHGSKRASWHHCCQLMLKSEFDKPRSTWKELTPANAKGALIDDHRMLEVLAGEVGEFEKLKQEDRFAILRGAQGKISDCPILRMLMKRIGGSQQPQHFSARKPRPRIRSYNQMSRIVSFRPAFHEITP